MPGLHASLDANLDLDSADAPEGSSSGSAKTSIDARSEVDSADEGLDEGLVLCRACDQLITDLRQRIRVQDAHEHRFMNPGGFLCFIECGTLKGSHAPRALAPAGKARLRQRDRHWYSCFVLSAG